MGTTAERHILPEFTHIKGRHCGSTSLMNLQSYQFRGPASDLPLDISAEANCFGLGAGMGFYYGVNLEEPRSYMMGRSRNLTENYFESLEIPHEIMEFDTPDELVEFVQGRIRNDVPVIIQSDVHFLPYYKSPQHFTGHTFLGVGLDGNDLLTSDCSFSDLQRTDFDSLKQAVSYPSPLFSGANKCYLMLGPGNYSAENLEAAVYRSLQYTIEDYSGDFTQEERTLSERSFQSFNPGLKALEIFRDEFMDTLFSLPTPGTEALWLYQLLERRGTGGGFFRPMMSEYYRNAAEFLNSPGLEEAARICTTLGEDWRKFAALLKTLALDVSRKRIPDAAAFTGRPELAKQVEQVYEGETDLIAQLEQILNKAELL